MIKTEFLWYWKSSIHNHITSLHDIDDSKLSTIPHENITKNGYELIKDEKVDYTMPTCNVIGWYSGKILQNISRLFIFRIR